MGKPVYDDGKVHVISEKCATCVFRPGNLMRLGPGRLKGMVQGSLEDGAGITCHSTIYGQAEQEAICRGYYDSYGDQVVAIKVAQAMGVIEEVEPPRKDRDGQT